ncbi:isochorismatase family cysteine hydrolase [Clostridium tagluense]|uniref:isochorismatase family cysteine hydrolase n=1 Tax=Clostridium tagluense TaxID=360422 RepID=UPI001C6E11D5|nr:isochorismatase family cysteine hydrolase [Clostridium tagluense]MBW9159035.1 cysteine hydrolase [Clostridium tagluense]WLC63620.1 cysteine hydrolase [Clostridium tagluense]
MKSALLIIDMQKLFKSLKNTEFEDILIPNIGKALNAARNKNMAIIHVRTIYKKDKSNWPRVRMHYEKMWCQEDSLESEFIDELMPLVDELVIDKSRFSSFYNTNLENYLYENKIEHIYIAGYATDVCIRFTAVDAYNRDILVTILNDCVLSEREENEQAIEYLKVYTKCLVSSINEINK